MNKKEEEEKPIKYGDVFNVSGELAAKPIAPQDAATVEAAEKSVLGWIPKSGMAAVMKSAADHNEHHGLVRHDDITDAVKDSGTEIAETTVVGHRLISESIGGQLLGRFAMDE
ncbi:late embryogenesis abundant protein D-34-like [Salvia hispanica]|uniref:late embryogenesis abundant protein D-34-like n=1 Tax=Salvia hispanica TaxID=49212 RepID=UPI002009BFA5|nr:late embryogenesis abundant protein D-34-like [Salvia hispanica]